MLTWSANVQWVLVSTLLLGIASGLVGTLSYWKKQSLMSDAVSHSALPGVVISYLIIGYKHSLGMLLGAFISGIIGAWFIYLIKQHSKLKEDTAMGIILSVFFGLGLMLLTFANRLPNGSQSGLDNFIFGQAAAMVREDVWVMSGLALIVMLFIIIGYKEWKIYLFDASFAQGLGLPIWLMNGFYFIVLVTTIVIGMQAVGVILMAALLIIPVTSASYWTDRLARMFGMSAFIGGLSGVLGTLISTLGKGWPTGPFIVVVAAVLFVFSMLFGTHRGIIRVKMRRKQNRQEQASRAQSSYMDHAG